MSKKTLMAWLRNAGSGSGRDKVSHMGHSADTGYYPAYNHDINDFIGDLFYLPKGVFMLSAIIGSGRITNNYEKYINR